MYRHRPVREHWLCSRFVWTWIALDSVHHILRVPRSCEQLSGRDDCFHARQRLLRANGKQVGGRGFWIHVGLELLLIW